MTVVRRGSSADDGLNRVVAVYSDVFAPALFVVALVFAFIVRSCVFLPDFLVPIPVGVGAVATLVTVWVVLLCAPMPLVREPGRACLLQLVFWPPRDPELGPLPAWSRLVALTCVVVISAPFVAFFADLSHTARTVDIVTGWMCLYSPAFAISYGSWKVRRRRA